MTIGNTDQSINMLPFLSEEMERTLRLRAWKDEIFREALIANPKGVIQRLFPQCFPDGKLAEELTIKVLEEDPDVCHIVLPSLLDEFPTPEIPEEEHLELLAHMGAERGFERVDNSEQRKSQLPEKSKPFDVVRRGQSENKSLAEMDVKGALKEHYQNNKEFRKQVQALEGKTPEEARAMSKKILQEHFPDYLSGGKVPERQTLKVTRDTSDTRHLVLPKLPDTSLDTDLSKHEQWKAMSGDITCKATSC